MNKLLLRLQPSQIAEAGEEQLLASQVHFGGDHAQNLGPGDQVFRREGVADGFDFAFGLWRRMKLVMLDC